MKTLSKASGPLPPTILIDPPTARLHALLAAPVLPTMVVLSVQTFVSVAETYFVSFLGTYGRVEIVVLPALLRPESPLQAIGLNG